MALSSSHIQTIKNEFKNDPLARSYSGMSDHDAKDNLNTADRTVNRNVLSPGEAQVAVISSEYDSLAHAKRDLWQAILSDTIDINNTNIQTQITDIWTVGTTTRKNLDSLKTKLVSRAAELGVGIVKVGDVQQGRA